MPHMCVVGWDNWDLLDLYLNDYTVLALMPIMATMISFRLFQADLRVDMHNRRVTLVLVQKGELVPQALHFFSPTISISVHFLGDFKSRVHASSTRHIRCVQVRCTRKPDWINAAGTPGPHRTSQRVAVKRTMNAYDIPDEKQGGMYTCTRFCF